MYNKFRLCNIVGHDPHRLLVVDGDIFSECSACGRVIREEERKYRLVLRVYNDSGLDELLKEYMNFEKLRDKNIDEAIKTVEDAPDSFENLEDAESIKDYLLVLDSSVSSYNWLMKKLEKKIAVRIPLYEKWIKVTVNGVEYALAKIETANKEEPFEIYIELWDERGAPPEKQYEKRFV